MSTLSVSPAPLLEREAALEALRAAQAEGGRLVLVAGEAGVGKTALVRAYGAALPAGARVLAGSCEALFTPRPLGPLADVAEATGGALARLVARGAPAHEVLAPLLDELERRGTILVLEDLHWADEATLDLLRILGRRIGGTRAVVVGTYRDDELADAHPLREVLVGLRQRRGVSRLRLDPLSAHAVAVLAEPYGVDGEELHRRTGGNAFYVTEALATPDESLPESVLEAVLARATRLGESSRALLEVVAVEPRGIDQALLETVAPTLVERLDDCVGSGMLEEERGLVRFRHELARLAVAESTPPRRARLLHRRVLEALVAGGADPARLAHHAEAAHDAPAVVEYARLAADAAARIGAHREAAAQYARALRFAEELSDAEVAELLGLHGHELHVTGRVAEAADALRDAVERWHAAGEELREGEQLCALSRALSGAGRPDEADEALRQALALLETHPPGRELAQAYATLASQRAVELDVEAAIAWGHRAIELAEQVGDTHTRAWALVRVGGVEGLREGASGLVGQGLGLALEHGYHDVVALAFNTLTVRACRRGDHATATRTIGDGLRYATDHGLDPELPFLTAWRASLALDHGDWDAAARDAQATLAEPVAPLIARVTALMVLGSLRARRGDPEVWRPLDEASALAVRTTEHQKQAPLAVTRAEAAVLGGDADRAAAELEPFDAAALADRWVAGAVAVWKERLGVPQRDVGELPAPYALELAGDRQAAAVQWHERGCRYHEALALGWSGDLEDLRSAHATLLALGARATAALVARRLRERGARGVSRGPRPSTQANPAQLTRRQLDVLRLVAAGLRNADVAEQLFLSPRTVDHHVSTILRKLEVRSRAEAGVAARRLGLLADPPSSPT